MKNMNKSRNRGAVDIWMLTTIGLILLAIGVGIFAGWSYMNYTDQKTDVDGKISDAVSLAKKEQADSDEVKFAEREKQPNREFNGPDDYGQVSFNYPKTWSMYVSKDAAAGGIYEAYFNPISVPAIIATQQYALHVTIEQKEYDKALVSYDALVKKGDLKSSSVKVGEATGTRIDGIFSKDIHGSAVIFKIRDKVLTVRTDAEAFVPDFDALIQTIKFNQ